ncbi:MAG TPA: hypothetical protein IAB06_03550 [Candidatus Avacidaminococcus intestinavium]|uniref:Uncharacterized protein n=1 Tax=Candidatus Avacidaminococcus intestinavium TaxID=2840684 RepID=A0A9D1SLK6_9FIRM|nr:hypothetical protein [Candidatus Avacidaminococcus intestinavium]
MLQDPSFVEGLDKALAENPDLTEYNGIIVKGVDIQGRVIDATTQDNRDKIIQGSNNTIKSIMNGVYDIAISEALGVVENSKVLQDATNKYQWAIVTKKGIGYVRKIPLIGGTTLLVKIDEASKYMSDEELKSYVKKEGSKFIISYGTGAVAGGAIGGPPGFVVGVFVGVAFEELTEKTYEKYFR